MSVDRTWYNTLVDDSGSGTDGTIVNKAFIDSLLDAVDLMENAPWVVETFNAGYFQTESAMVWTVAAGDVDTLAHRRRGRTVTVAVCLSTTSVTAPLGNVLRINHAMFGGVVPTRTMVAPLAYFVDGGVLSAGFLRVDAGVLYLRIYRQDLGNFTASVNATHIFGTITFEVDA